MYECLLIKVNKQQTNLMPLSCFLHLKGLLITSISELDLDFSLLFLLCQSRHRKNPNSCQTFLFINI
jgi:hypothetical protein